MFGKTELLANNLRKGIVYIKPLFQNNNFKISKLTLKPNSEILEHLHANYNEVFFIYEKGKDVRIEICQKGQKHLLKNLGNYDITIFSVICK